MDTDRHRLGQAAIEFALGAFLLALVVSALTGIAAVLLRGQEIENQVRAEAGLNALASAAAETDQLVERSISVPFTVRFFINGETSEDDMNICAEAKLPPAGIAR